MLMSPARPATAALITLLAALPGCSKPDTAGWTGYAEGETLYLAAPVAGRLSQLAVEQGQAVVDRQLLFTLDPGPETALSAEAQARADSARAQALDADKGRRREELAITEAQLRQARAQLDLARADAQRQQQLQDQGFVARARADDAATVLRQAQARVTELEAALQSARLPARDDARAAAQALARAASSAKAQSDWRMAQLQQAAPQSGRITAVYYRPGEWVNAGQPVLALLPPAQRKARFYVPEPALGQLALQQRVLLSCDGCPAAVPARISYIAPQAEYTPPVLYSNQQRAKLVFMVEARPEQVQEAERLHPGQPLDVRLAP
ncbi:HlyD family efflux transporter periplasmic adaptor subunit [Paucibacter sp. APW11]|uniref:HlyD family efflux transporter periplasmic adaptor subunit n=1 Tax=Roseateles aquae TaxID=3077235 RepID=A0ABU3P6D7_9BURK|nr:HlyD family efflux transporter periplasmic adaptor subunit [Paucibacter sp. APW11]MDT8998129.1 HlyD family efflux transporter periplasmic adaptor subunit [Paucibacter sp. APW11]